MNRKNRATGWIAALLASCWMGSAFGGGGIGGTGARMGLMRAYLTDAPSCHAAVHVTVEKLRVHASGTASDADAGWSEITVSPARRVNLVELTNGAMVALGETGLPAGRYGQLRLQLAPNDTSRPLANAVRPHGGVETPLTLPHGAQRGFKVAVDLEVHADQATEVVLDFDACRSVVPQGATGGWLLKPVLSATALLPGGGQRVEGWVEPSLASVPTQVSLQLDGVPVKATVPDAQGRFVLYPVPVGRYDLVVAAPSRATAVLTGVPVAAAGATRIGSETARIALGASTTRIVHGRIWPTWATVRARQFAGGTPIEAGWSAVDAASGHFALTLPLAPPVKAPYAAGGKAPVFVPAVPAGGRFLVEAQAGVETRVRALDAGAPLPPLLFIFH